MKVVIDTCSLRQLVRYYLPFDNDGVLLNFFKEKIESGDVILLDKVIDECKYMSKGVIIEKMPFLCDAKYLMNTIDIIPKSPRKFFNMLNNNFAVNELCNALEPTVYETVKTTYTRTADFSLIVYCHNHKFDNADDIFYEPLVILTEETSNSNDKKYFKKIPDICKFLKIKTLSLPEYFKNDNIDISILRHQ